MGIRGKPIESINEDDIRQLLENQESESLTLEYKSDLHIEKDGEKKEFLNDVSSFANKIGGDIIYGIEEKRDENSKHTGIPEKVCGIAETNIDELKRRIESIISSGLDPKLMNLGMKDIQFEGQNVLILRIPRSLMAPHMVIYQKSGKFYARNNSGKDQMNTDELRRAFLQTEYWERLAIERNEKCINNIKNNPNVPKPENYFPLSVNCYPLGINRNLIDINKYFTHLETLFRGFYTINTFKYNYEGILWHNYGNQRFIQLHRDGAIEIYLPLWPTYGNLDQKHMYFINGEELENLIIKSFVLSLKFLKIVEIEPPFSCFLNLMNLQGCHMIKNRASIDWVHEGDLRIIFDRSDITISTEIINSLEANHQQVLEPILDIIWQAGGWSESPWKGHRKWQNHV